MTKCDDAFEKYRTEKFGAYAEYPIDAYTYFGAGWNAAIAAFHAAQPCTAENPNEDSYQRGRFDGVMDYGKAVIALKY